MLITSNLIIASLLVVALSFKKGTVVSISTYNDLNQEKSVVNLLLMTIDYYCWDFVKCQCFVIIYQIIAFNCGYYCREYNSLRIL